MDYSFESSVESVAKIDCSFTEDEIRTEPMLYGFSVNNARTKGGPITNSVLEAVIKDIQKSELLTTMSLIGYHPVIDTKSVLLMPNQYPCIPGWHCDGVMRGSRGAQPNLNTLGEPVYHYICTITESNKKHNGTAYLEEGVYISKKSIDDSSVWKSVNRVVEELNPHKGETESGEVVKFKRSQLHKGTAAKERCWRYFFRLSFYHMPAVNEIRNQVQVYTDLNEGW